MDSFDDEFDESNQKRWLGYHQRYNPVQFKLQAPSKQEKRGKNQRVQPIVTTEAAGPGLYEQIVKKARGALTNTLLKTQNALKTMAEISDEDESNSSSEESSSESLSPEELEAAKKEADLMSMGSANTSPDGKHATYDRPGTGNTVNSDSQYGRGLDSESLDKIDLEDPQTRLDIINNENKKHLIAGKNDK